MKIIHSLDDFGFKAENLEQLKEEIIKDCSVYGYMPSVNIVGDFVEVDIDDKLLMRTQQNFEKSSRFCNEGKLQRAKVLLEEVIKTCPMHTDALRNLAQVEYMEGDMKSAFFHAEQAYRTNPKDTSILLLLGNMHYSGGDIRMAEIYYLSALKQDSDNCIALTNLAGICLKKNNIKAAEEYCNRTMTLDDTYLNNYMVLAMVYDSTQNHRAALDICIEGLKKGRDRSENPGVRQHLTDLAVGIATNIVKQTDWWSVIDKCIASLESYSGHGVDYHRDTEIQVLAKLQYWKLYNRDVSTVIYNDSKPCYEHFIMHELMHLKMAQEATNTQKGKAIVSNDEMKAAFADRFAFAFNKLGKRIQAGAIEGVVSTLYGSLVSRLMNAPLDLYVEKMLYEDFKELHPLQFLSLYNQEKSYCESDTSKMSEVFPPAIVSTSRITNVAQSMLVKDLYGIDFTALHGASRLDKEHAAKLYDMFKEDWSKHTPGDEYDLMKRFTDSLNMSELFEIVDEDEYVGKQYGTYKSDIDKMLEKMRDESNAKFAREHCAEANPGEAFTMAMYMVDAIRLMKNMNPADVKKIFIEIAMVGVTGISPDRKSGYKIESFPDKDFSGKEFLAWYYVSGKIACPDILPSLQLPYEESYKLAEQIFNSGNK